MLALAQATSDLVGTATASGEVIYLNPAGRRMLGLGMEASLAEVRARDLHPEWAWRRLEEVGFPSAEREGSWQGETAFLDAESQEIPVWQVITAHGDAAGEARFFSTIARDLTGWRRTRRELRERVKELRTLYDVSRILSRWDAPLSERLQEAADRIPEGMLHPEVTEVRIRLRGMEISTGGFRVTPSSFEVEIRSRNERVGEIQVVLAQAPDATEGSVSPFLKEERELLQAITRVIGDAVERERLQTEFFQVQKMETIGRLAGGTAHDFNNLLSVILGHAEIALDSLPKESPARDDLRHLIRAAERGATLTHQLLAFSRKQVLSEQDVDLCDTLFEVEPMLRRLVPSRIELQVVPGGEPLPVRVDPGKFDQVVLNLVVNAIQAISDGGEITLSLDLRTLTPREAADLPWRAEEGDYAELAVRDTGSGMEPETLDRLFEPFFTTKAEGEGTGLGLSMVFGFVKQSRGHIFVESAPGEGSAFRLLLPMREAASGEPNLSGSMSAPDPQGGSEAAASGTTLRARTGGGSAADGAPPARAEAAPLRAEGGGDSDPKPSRAATPRDTILVVEDNDAVRSVLVQTLERAGFQVLEAPDGRAALELARGTDAAISTVLSDVVMPRMGGAALLRELRASFPALRIILMSGYSDQEVTPEVRALADGFITKPFTAREVVAVLGRTLEGPAGPP